MIEDPQFRIGDAEREAALRDLGEHLAAGRLDIEEYGARSARIAAAKTRQDLVSVFSDLPSPRPRFPHAPPLPPPPRPASRRHPAELVVPIAGIAGVVLFLFVLRGFWPVLLLPLVAMLLLGRHR